jgi:MscS family membrane protein
MLRLHRPTLLIALYLALVLPLGAQTALTQALQPAAPAANTNAATDPLGRNTPSNAILGFLKAAQDGDYSIAAQYLQMSAARRQVEGEQTAAKLKFVLDHAFSGNLSRYNQPEGTPQEGVALGRQKLGTMTAGDVEVDLDLVRVSDPSAGKIWLISADTLAKLPELSDQVEARQVEHKLPSVLVKHQFAGMPLWQWVAMLLAISIAAGLGWLVLALL